ncbi:Sterol 24-C-methyltransferase [Balamuthia mandrillaris]
MEIGTTVKSIDASKVEGEVKSYLHYHDDKKEDHSAERKSGYATMVNQYYNLATDFYEWGWGSSFHFAIQARCENFYQAISRHEHYLAHRLDLQRGMRVLDVGCGVGGPARSIARFSEAHVTGITLNKYQVDRATLISQKQGLSPLVRFVQGDFMKLPFEDESFDSVYQIEATAHAPDKVACYREIFRVLKPGQLFGGYEWCLTPLYDPTNPEHVAIKKGIEEGDGLPDIATCEEVLDALKQAGFEIVDSYDVAVGRDGQNDPRGDAYNLPWFHYLTPGLTPSRIQFTSWGKASMLKVLGVFEKVGLVPKGTTGVSEFLQTAAVSLVRGGELGIFTPMFFHLARKPAN